MGTSRLGTCLDLDPLIFNRLGYIRRCCSFLFFIFLVLLSRKSPMQLTLLEEVVDTVQGKREAELGETDEKKRPSNNNETKQPCVCGFWVVPGFGDESIDCDKLYEVVQCRSSGVLEGSPHHHANTQVL